MNAFERVPLYSISAVNDGEENGIWIVSYDNWTVEIDNAAPNPFVPYCDALILGLEAPAVTLDELERVWPPAEGVKKRRKISSRPKLL